MATQVRSNHYCHQTNAMAVSTPSTSLNSLPPLLLRGNHGFFRNKRIASERSLGFDRKTSRRLRRNKGRECAVVVASSGNADLWDSWKPQKSSRESAPSLSDVLWPSAGAFAAMAILGKMDKVLAAKGISMTIAPVGAVCAVLFASPSSPAARKYNMFMAQIGCAAIGVGAFTIFGPGWLARSAALAASIAFMIYTRSTHPPAASLPILFIDGVKLHPLSFWYAFFPGAAGCIILSLIQEVVCYLKDNFNFEHSGGIRLPDTAVPSSTNHECPLASTSCIWYNYYSRQHGHQSWQCRRSQRRGDTLAVFSNKLSNPSSSALEKTPSFSINERIPAPNHCFSHPGLYLFT
ncbi:hypothetical protein V6N13_048992 [Hibiscus sabdariffa]|uniref:HPP transmembrane region domain-containing protein n=1 Tax=Hibiscus sabdariffa TaxID=183260 RepID=A0ABR2QZ34_9ROSI